MRDAMVRTGPEANGRMIDNGRLYVAISPVGYQFSRADSRSKSGAFNVSPGSCHVSGRDTLSATRTGGSNWKLGASSKFKWTHPVRLMCGWLPIR